MSRKLNIPTVIGIVLMCCALTFFVTYLAYEQIWPKLSGYEASIDQYQTKLDEYAKALEGKEDYYEGYAKYTEIRELIDSYYVNDYDEQELNDGMAAGVVAGIGDKWAYYVSAENYADYALSGQNAYFGIGITIQAEDVYGGYSIVRVAEDGPAKDAGVKLEDVLVGVNGESIIGMDIETVKSMVKGETGTPVTITVMRNGAEMNITAVRGTASYEIVHYELMDDNVGYVKIDNFEGNSAAKFIAACDDLIGQGATSLVFDVRNNPGGLMEQLLTILDYLLPQGETFIQVDYKGNETIYTSDESFVDLPMMVITNENSYSAAEYFAAILQENQAAKVVGAATSGKGNYQVPLPLSDGSAISISVGTYYTPSRRSLAETGVTPDYKVEMDDEAFAKLYYGVLEKSDDEQLKQAVYLAALDAN